MTLSISLVVDLRKSEDVFFHRRPDAKIEPLDESKDREWLRNVLGKRPLGFTCGCLEPRKRKRFKSSSRETLRRSKRRTDGWWHRIAGAKSRLYDEIQWWFLSYRSNSSDN